MRTTRKRSAAAARAANQRIDAHMQAIFKAAGSTVPDSDTIHRELRKRVNLCDLFAIDIDSLVYIAENEKLRHWLRDRREYIGPSIGGQQVATGKRKAGSIQRSYPHDGTRYIHLIAVLAEATRDPGAEDADERRKNGRKVLAALIARYKALGGPYLAQAALLKNIDNEVKDKSVVFEQPKLAPEEFTA